MKNNTPTMKSKVIIPLVIVILIFTSIGTVLYNNSKEIREMATTVPPTVNSMPVKIAAVEQRSPDNNFELSGSFEARQTLPLIAEAQGSIIQFNIKEGQSIRAGQIIARIDTMSIQSNLVTAQAAFNNAIKNKERFQRLADAGAISQKQYEDVALNVENARAHVQSVQQQMNYTIIRSPMSGIVSEVKVEMGSFATPGMNLGSVVDISRLKMVVKVSEQDVIKLKMGQPVAISTEVYPEQIFNGTISLISVQADAARKYNMEVEVPNSDMFPLKAGMFGTVRLQTQNTDNVEKIFIPRKSIVGSIQNPQVFVLNNDSTVTLKDIEVQNQNNDEVVVLKGLTTSEKVITAGQINLQTGSKVRVVE